MQEASTLSGLLGQERRALEAQLPDGWLLRLQEVVAIVWSLTSCHITLPHGAVIDPSRGWRAHPGLLSGGVSEPRRPLRIPRGSVA
jgi:hypothetical protein